MTRKSKQIRCFTTAGLQPYPGGGSSLGNSTLVTQGDLFQGAIDCTANPNYPAADKNMWWLVTAPVLPAIAYIGGGSGKPVQEGDMIICIATSVGGTEAAVGTQWTVKERDITSATVTVLRTGTSDSDFVTPNVLADQLNGGSAVFSAATLMSLSGGTTEQLKLTTTAAQKGLTISSTAQTGSLVSMTTAIGGASVNLISLMCSTTTALTADAVLGYYTRMTSNAADNDTSIYQVNYMNPVSTALSQATMEGIVILHSGTASGAAGSQPHKGISIVPTLTMTTASSLYTGIHCDFSGMTVAGTAGATYGIYMNTNSTTTKFNYGFYGIDAVSTLGLLKNSGSGNIGLEIISDTTTANSISTITTSRDINGTVVGAVALTNFANTLGQAVNHTAGDFIVTQTATTAGIMNLVLAHTAAITGALTAPDVFASTALNIGVTGATTGGTGNKLDVSARALDIAYTITEGAGDETRMATTDIARIVLDVQSGITSAGAYNLTMLNLNGSAYLGNDANTTLRGINIDLSGAKTVSVMRGIDITMEAASTTSSTGIYVDAGSSTSNTGISIAAWQAANANSTSQALLINKIVSVSGTPAANSTNSSYAARISMANLNSCTDGSDALCTANGLEIIYTTTSTADTVITADTLTGTALKLTLACTTAANAFSAITDFSPKGLLVDYDISFGAASTITVTPHNIIDINYNTGATTAATYTFSSGSYNFFNITATNSAASPDYAATSTITGYRADFANMVVSDANLVLYGINITMPTDATVSTVVGMNVVADTTLLTNAMQTIVTSKDLAGAIAADRTISAYSVDFSTNVTNSTAGDFDITNSAGILSLTLAHTTNVGAAKTHNDTFSGTTLYVHTHATTTATANDKLTTTARALDVDYTCTFGAASTHYLDPTDVARIDFNVAAGTVINNVAGGTGITMLRLDGNGFVPGANVSNATTISGLLVDWTSADVADAQATLYGVNVVMPTADHSATAAAIGIMVTVPSTTDGAIRTTDGTQILTLSNGASHLSSTTTMIVDMPVTAPGAGFDTATGVYYLPHGKKGTSGMIIAEWYVDLNNAAVSASATDGDAIGEAAGGAAYIGQITAALNGTVQAIEVICMEVPTVASADINIYSNASNALVYDDALGGGTLLIDAAGAWTLGMMKVANNLPAANDYVYLGVGAAGGNGAYGAGKFLIRIYGV